MSDHEYTCRDRAEIALRSGRDCARADIAPRSHLSLVIIRHGQRTLRRHVPPRARHAGERSRLVAREGLRSYLG